MIASYTLNDTSTPFVNFCMRSGLFGRYPASHHSECKTAALQGGVRSFVFSLLWKKPWILWMDLLKRI